MATSMEVIDLEDEENSQQEKNEVPGEFEKTASNEKSQSSTVPKLSRCRAPVYHLFTWNSADELWKCNLCKSGFKHHKHSGSAVLNVHARKKHPKEFQSISPGLRQDTLSSHVVKQKPPPQTVTKEGVWSLVMQFIVETDQSFNVVEAPSLSRLINYVSRENPNAKLSKKDAVRESISKLFEERKRNLLDCWTSSNQYSYQGVIATWIDENWKMQVALLDLTIIDGPHTGENLATELAAVVTDYGLWGKTMSITTDNASNMDTMLVKFEELALENGSQFSAEKFRVRCMAHIINLACKAIVKNVEQFTGGQNFEAANEFDDDGPGIVSKIRSAINAVRGSPQRRLQFKKICARQKIKHLVLMRDVRTRWNSTLDMLLRVREMREVFIEICQNNRDLARYALEQTDWDFTKQLAEMLQPFKETTYLISKETPTLSCTTQAYQFLFTHLEQFIDGEPAGPSSSKRGRRTVSPYPEWLVNAAKEGWEKLKQYYPSSDGLVYTMATVMDPRLKLDWYKAIEWEVSWQRQAKRALNQEWERSYKTNDDIPETQNPGDNEASTSVSDVSKRGSSFTSLLNEKMKEFQKPEDELKQYLSETVVSNESLGTDGILGWWKRNADRFPKLSRMSMDVLGVHGTGVSVERFFSSAPDLLTVRRQRLSPETIRQTLVLKQWFKRNHKQNSDELIVDCRVSKALGDADNDEN